MEVVRKLQLAQVSRTDKALETVCCGTRHVPVDSANYLLGIAETVIAGLSMTGKARLDTDFARRVAIPLEAAVPLGLIVGELVAKSIKYAHPAVVAGVVNLEVSPAPGAMMIAVSDDGVGLPESMDPIASAGAGFGMARTLAAQLGASIAYDNHGLGLSWILRMPNAELVQ